MNRGRGSPSAVVAGLPRTAPGEVDPLTERRLRPSLGGSMAQSLPVTLRFHADAVAVIPAHHALHGWRFARVVRRSPETALQAHRTIVAKPHPFPPLIPVYLPGVRPGEPPILKHGATAQGGSTMTVIC